MNQEDASTIVYKILGWIEIVLGIIVLGFVILCGGYASNTSENKHWIGMHFGVGISFIILGAFITEKSRIAILLNQLTLIFLFLLFVFKILMPDMAKSFRKSTHELYLHSPPPSGNF